MSQSIKNDAGRGKLPQDARGGANGLSVVLALLWVAALVTLGIGQLPHGQPLAQGESPRLYFPPPKNTNVFSFGSMDISNKFDPCIQTKESDNNTRTGVLAHKRFLLPSQRLDPFPFSPITGCGTGSVSVDPKSTSLNPVINASRGSRFSAPNLGFGGGLTRLALKPVELVKHKQGFRPYGPAGAYLPTGQYNGSKPLDLGVKRRAVGFGVPTVMPFGNPSWPASLEVIPAYPGYRNPFGGWPKARGFVPLGKFGKGDAAFSAAGGRER
jgi:hypothetical protein